MGILLSMSSNAFSSCDGFSYGRLATVGCAGRTFSFAKVQGDPKTTILIELEIF